MQTFSCAGFFAGVTEAILVNPFEVVKVKLQSNRKHIKESPSTFAVTKEIISKYGLNGLNKGLSATIMRNAVFNSFYFGFYHSVKGYVPVSKEPWLEFLTKVIIQLCVTTKTYIQNCTLFHQFVACTENFSGCYRIRVGYCCFLFKHTV